MLAGQGEFEADAVVGVGGGEGGIRHQGFVDLVVEEGRHGYSLGEGIGGHEVHGDGLRTVGGLGVSGFDFANQSLVLRE